MKPAQLLKVALVAFVVMLPLVKAGSYGLESRELLQRRHGRKLSTEVHAQLPPGTGGAGGGPGKDGQDGAPGAAAPKSRSCSCHSPPGKDPGGGGGGGGGSGPGNSGTSECHCGPRGGGGGGRGGSGGGGGSENTGGGVGGGDDYYGDYGWAGGWNAQDGVMPEHRRHR